MKRIVILIAAILASLCSTDRFNCQARRARESRLGFTLAYTYFVGGSGNDKLWWFRDPALTKDGSLFLAGCTTSTDFPTTPDALYPAYRGGNKWGAEDAFIVEFNTRRPRIGYATYFGGASGPDFISDMRLGPGKRIYLTGNTGAPDLPVTPNAWQPKFSGPDFRHADGFLAVLAAGGRRLEYLSYIGGSGNDSTERAFRDKSGAFTIFGITESRKFPAAETSRGQGLRDGGALFSMTLDPSGQHLLESRLVGNSGTADVTQLRRGGFVMAGTTNNPGFPVTAGAWNRPHIGATEGNDIFALWMAPDGDVSAATLFGGSASEGEPRLVKVTDDDIVIAGSTRSRDLPVTPDAAAKVPAGEGPGWAYLARLDRLSSRLVYSTYLPGVLYVRHLSYDGRGHIYVIGTSGSSALPVTANAIQPAHRGGLDGFLLVFNIEQKRIEYCTYLGGSGEDEAFTMALSPRGEVFVIGQTNSDDFPAGARALSTRRGFDIFITKLTPHSGERERLR